METIIAELHSLYPIKFIPQVYHVGLMNKWRRLPVERRSSLEGNALSVSLHPEAWTQIAKLGGGQTWALHRSDAAYLDMHELTEGQRRIAVDWACDHGLAERKILWRVWSYDDEHEEWNYFTFGSEDRAMTEIRLREEISSEDDLPPHLQGTGTKLPIECASATVLTEAGSARAHIYHSADEVNEDQAIAFWAEDVLRQAMPNLVGLWWDENLDPFNYSAPRGAVFASLLKRQVKVELATNMNYYYEDDVVAPATIWVPPAALTSQYKFVTDCVNATSGEVIHEMVDNRGMRDLDYKSFVRKLGNGKSAAGQRLIDMVLPYPEDLHISTDPYVGFHESVYQGVPCLYVQHSRIEYIFQRARLLAAAQVNHPVRDNNEDVAPEEELDEPDF